MEQLPKEEFKKGNFVVKWNESKFSQVRPVHNLEWLNGIRKRGGGIVGITKTPLALSRWALSYNLRSQIADNTYTMLGSHQEDKFSHNESTPGRKDRDKNQVNDQIHVKEQALEQEISNIESSHGAQKYGEAWKTVNEITGRKKAKEGQISGASREERV